MSAALVGALAIGMVVSTTTVGRRLARRVGRAVRRAARYQTGRLEGVRYRAARRGPDPEVDGRVLADRVRSMLGPVERRLDVPHVHVQTVDHQVLLHGDVASREQCEAIEEAVRGVPGVHEVRSHLHVGLLAGESKPSDGKRHRPTSDALGCILVAARRGGAPAGSERTAASSVLSTFLAMLPVGERRHVLVHLPGDVRELLEPSRSPRMADGRQPRRLGEFESVALPTYEPDQRRALVASVVGALRDLVPEELYDVAAVLPAELLDLWKTAMPH